jgi:hypothetical protein
MEKQLSFIVSYTARISIAIFLKPASERSVKLRWQSLELGAADLSFSSEVLNVIASLLPGV